MTALADQSTFPAGAWWPVVAACLAGAFAWRLVAALWWAGSRRICDALRSVGSHPVDCAACRRRNRRGLP
jgi:hypothetical protein